MTSTSTPPRAATPLPRWPFALLGMMTATTVLGPFLIGWVLSGGARTTWPPDRTVEWVTLVGTSGLVLVLMVLCLSVGLIQRSRMARRTRPADSAPAPPGISA